MNPIRFRQQFFFEESLGVKAHRDPLGMLLFCWHSLALYPYRLGIWLQQHLNILLQEIRSLLGRISIRTQENHCVVVGPGWERCATQHLVPCTRTQARSSCISQLLSKYPWATLVDVEILLVGWDMGEKWAVQNSARQEACGKALEWYNEPTASSIQAPSIDCTSTK
jgi:hypothetical protein